MTALALLCTTAAAALLVRGPDRVRPPAGEAATGPARRRRRPALALGGVVVVLGLTVSARLAVLLVIGSGVVLAGIRLVTARRSAREADARRARVIELCEGLRAELAAGQTADAALERAATDWPLVGPAARVAVAGGDVPSALRDLAAHRGAGSLRVVAAAWQVAHRTGHGLADVIGRVADDLRSGEQTRRVVLSELASARATARLLAVLPVLALAMGAGAGAAPWTFLLATPLGLACLAGGLGLAVAGLAWVEALARASDQET